MSLGGKRWLRPDKAAETVIMARELGIPLAVAAVLVNRGIADPGAARAFLSPSLEQLHSPWLMRGMKEAVERINQALQSGEKIVIYGDYDADGICACAILLETLSLPGGQVDFYLPSRFQEGYGLNTEALEYLHDGGAGLVVTVDCGINSVAEAAYARKIGLDLIITDHHQPLETESAARAVLNPRQAGCSYPFKDLTGSGIAFKLAEALAEKWGRAFPAELLDLAALGTVADVAPLLGENRAIVVAGLQELSRLRRPGLKALAAVNGLTGAKITSFTVAYVLAPAVNAPGRMGEAEPAVRLLLERDESEAAALARRLQQENALRRETERRVLREAEDMLSADRDAAGERVITLAAEGWHSGTIGIVASRLAERHYRPVLLVALENGIGRGSARAIPGFNITAALAACAQHLQRFGGHDQAAGLTVAADKVLPLRASLNLYAKQRMDPDSMQPALILESELSGADLNIELARQLARLEPFGSGNPAPLFSSRGWELKSWRLVGSAKNHLKLNLTGSEQNLEPIMFSGARLEPLLWPGRELELAVSLKESSFRDRPVLELELKDLRYSDCALAGRVELIDRRGRGGRLRRLKDLLRCVPDVAIFVATSRRRDALKKNLAPKAAPLFITGGGISGGINGGLGAAEPPADLILYDLPLHDEPLRNFFRRCPPEGKVRLFLLYEQSDCLLNSMLLDLALPDFDALRQICRALAELAAAGEPVELTEALRRLSLKPAPSFVQRCREIIAETALAEPNRLPLTNLNLSEEQFREQLESSPSYREARELRKSCLSFEKRLLEASPAELAAHWEAQLALAEQWQAYSRGILTPADA